MDGTTRAQLRSVSGAAASPAGRAPIPYYNYRKSYYNYFTRQSLDYGVGGATRRHLAETAGIGTGVGLRLDVEPEPEERVKYDTQGCQAVRRLRHESHGWLG